LENGGTVIGVRNVTAAVVYPSNRDTAENGNGVVDKLLVVTTECDSVHTGFTYLTTFLREKSIANGVHVNSRR
jgi:hypothetical protein